MATESFASLKAETLFARAEPEATSRTHMHTTVKLSR